MGTTIPVPFPTGSHCKTSVVAQSEATPSTQRPSRMKCSLSPPPPLQPGFSQLFCVCSGIERRAQQQLMITWAAAQASQKQSWPHRRSRTAAPKVEHGSPVPAPSWARSQPELTAAMTSHVSPDLVSLLEKFPGRLSCVKAQSQISALYRALDACLHTGC